jgi:hypothetical protein
VLEQKLLLISRDDILSASRSSRDTEIFNLLAQFTRQGFHLLATAPQPDHWSDNLGVPDDALLGPESIRKQLADAGGVLDGVYYVPRSLLTQKRNREEALLDMLKRYVLSPGRCHLLSSSKKFVQAAESLGISVSLLDRDFDLIAALTRLSEANL